jgi:hypothetical protein
MVLALTVLQSCDTEKMQETHNSIQQNHFLQSLALVESAGSILQNPQLTQDDIKKAMGQMDEGLKQAFKVEMKFLTKLEVSLPKLYNEIFIKGVEQYRVGVEASDREKQIEGLNLLSQWGKYWQAEKPNIQQKLVNING